MSRIEKWRESAIDVGRAISVLSDALEEAVDALRQHDTDLARALVSEFERRGLITPPRKSPLEIATKWLNQDSNAIVGWKQSAQARAILIRLFTQHEDKFMQAVQRGSLRAWFIAQLCAEHTMNYKSACELVVGAFGEAVKCAQS